MTSLVVATLLFLASLAARALANHEAQASDHREPNHYLRRERAVAYAGYSAGLMLGAGTVLIGLTIEKVLLP